MAIALFLIFSASNAIAGESCLDLISPFLNTKKPISQNQTTVPISANARKKLLKEAKRLELSEKQIEAFFGQVDTLKERINPKLLEAYLSFLESLRVKNRIKAIEDMAQITAAKPESKLVKKFLNIQKKVDKKHASELKKIAKKLKQEKPNATRAQINRLAKKEAKEFRNQYERLAYGCKSTKWTPERKAAGKTFQRFVMGIGIVSSVGAYSYQNRDREKDAIWFGRLGYELTIGTLVGLLSSKIISNPQDNALKKGLKKWLLSRTTGLVDMGIYGALFGASTAEAEAKLQELLKDPEKKKEIEELMKAIEDKRLFQRLKEDVLDFVAPFAGSIGIDIEPEATAHIQGVDWSNLSSEDLEREDVQEVLLAAILVQSYEEEKGGLIQTGHVGADRFSFHSIYGAVMMPKDMTVSLYIYNTLCMGALNPKAALMKAVGVYTLNRLVFDQLYYYVRRLSINQ